MDSQIKFTALILEIQMYQNGNGPAVCESPLVVIWSYSEQHRGL